MDPELMRTIISTVPALITSGVEVWKNVVKPVLDKNGYDITEEQEQEMLALEGKKDVKAFIEKLEGITKEMSQNMVFMNHAGDDGLQVNRNEGIIDNSKKYFYSSEPVPTEIKKN